MLRRNGGKRLPVRPQQNNMSSYPQASYQHHHLFTKNHRLYQQLLQDDFPASPFAASPTPAHVASIKFAKPAPAILTPREPQYAPEREEFSPKLPRSGGLFKGFEAGLGRMSNQATQSLSSNYCITEHENEENSTVNIYSLSRNHIEPDLDLSRSPTAHIDPDQSLTTPPPNHHLNAVPSRPILEASLLNNHSIANNNSFNQSSEVENIKKYRSEQYSHLSYSPEEESEGKVPKVLAEKHLRNDITKKFSSGHNSEHEVQSNFKTVLNQIHVVPYLINNELKPYAYSTPVDNKQYSTQQNLTVASQPDRRGKANSLNLKNSGYSAQEEVATTPARHLYFSNHTQLHPARPTAHVTNSQAKTRPAPRSEPKYTANHERSNRSNSIECKAKPNLSINNDPDPRNPEQPKEHFEHSQVTKLFKNPSLTPAGDELLPQESSVIYESAGINVCCSLTSHTEQPSKINFLPRPRQGEMEEASPFFVSSIDLSRAGPPQQPKGASKINPIQMIRELSEPDSQRGIRLVGFPKKDRP